jgi:hypothetical protein
VLAKKSDRIIGLRVPVDWPVFQPQSRIENRRNPSATVIANNLQQQESGEQRCLMAPSRDMAATSAGAPGFKKVTRPGDRRAGRVRHGVDEAPVPDADPREALSGSEVVR